MRASVHLTRVVFARDHSHSIINKSPEPAWLKELAVIDKAPYRRFYRQPYRAFVDVWRWSDLRGGGDFEHLINQITS